VNKENPNFIFNKDANVCDVGHKRTLTSVFEILKNEGCDIPNLIN
jgi:tubulin polyglutamylase TTLL6/13